MTTAPILLRSRPRPGDRTRARLAEAALAEFRRVGLERASVSRIAKNAGVSRPTFYFYFPTKEHVLLDLQESLEKPLALRIAGAATLREALTGFVEGLVEAQDRVGNAALFGDMLRIYARRPAGVEIESQPFPLLEALTRRFSAAVKSGELRAGLDPVQAVRLFLTGVFGYLVSTPGPAQNGVADLKVLASLLLEERDHG